MKLNRFVALSGRLALVLPQLDSGAPGSPNLHEARREDG